MSIGHRLEDWELAETSLRDLFHDLGSNDTPDLFDQPFVVDASYDWPAAGGMSLDLRRVYIDRTLYQEVMDGEYAKSGLTPDQIIFAWCWHERTENALVAGDNAIDLYTPAHRRALAGEHEIYRACGINPAEAEKVFWPGFVRCYKRPIKKPPPDAWCGVYNDDPGPEEDEIIAQLIKLGVIDARKRSKYSSSYAIRGHRCDQCRNRDERVLKQGPLFGCTIVSGRIRGNRACDFWMPDDDPKVDLEDTGDKLTQRQVEYTDSGHAPEFCDKCMHWDKPDKCEVVKGAISPKGWCRLWHR
jgi:hypothetical protein